MSPPHEQSQHDRQPEGSSASREDAPAGQQDNPGERRQGGDRRVCYDRRAMIRFDEDRREVLERRENVDPFASRVQ